MLRKQRMQTRATKKGTKEHQQQASSHLLGSRFPILLSRERIRGVTQESLWTPFDKIQSCRGQGASGTRPRAAAPGQLSDIRPVGCLVVFCGPGADALVWVAETRTQ